MDKIPLIGFGIGGSGRGATHGIGLSPEAREGLQWAGEDEWKRIIYEIGPILGMMYIAFRVLLVVWLFRCAMKAVNRTSNPLPLLLIAFIGPIFAVWYINHIGSVHGYGFLFAGFCMAANQLGKRTPPSERTVWSD